MENNVKIGDYINVNVWPPPKQIKELLVIAINIKNLTVTVIDLLGNKANIRIGSIAKIHSKVKKS